MRKQFKLVAQPSDKMAWPHSLLREQIFMHPKRHVELCIRFEAFKPGSISCCLLRCRLWPYRLQIGRWRHNVSQPHGVVIHRTTNWRWNYGCM